MAAEHVKALGDRIRERREELGMTQDEVARQMKGTIDGQRISKWERGENRPRDESLEDLARVLKTTAVELLVQAPSKAETPDLSRAPADETQLDRLEAKMDRILALLTADEDELSPHIREILSPTESPPARPAKPPRRAPAKR